MAQSTIISNSPVVLFDSEAGATSGTLSQSVANFKRIRVTWGPSDRGYLLGMECYTHNSASFKLPVNYDTQASDTGSLFIVTFRIGINGTAFSTDRGYQVTVQKSASTDNVVSSWTAGRVFRIEGYY